MTDHVETIVIGAGVVGLAIARALALSGREVIVLESENAIGTGVSSRNSEVIHAGIYYAKDSLKARFCVRGKHLLYDYCKTHNVAHNRIGKLLVATSDDELQILDQVKVKAEINGVDDLEFVEADRIASMEPELRAVRALYSPSTGIVDSHGLMLALQGDAEDHGAMLAFSSPVAGVKTDQESIVVEVGGENPMHLSCAELVNAAGLGAPEIGKNTEGVVPELRPKEAERFAKGNYFVLQGKRPFKHLIYPVPVPGGLGTHSTLDLGGQTKFGPDVEWIDHMDYDVSLDRIGSFYRSIRRYWPGLRDGALEPGYVGIRPKIYGPEPGIFADDFVIEGPTKHGIDGLINLYGIESPGLTGCLAIAEEVCAMLKV